MDSPGLPRLAIEETVGPLRPCSARASQVQDDGKLLFEPAAILDFRWSKAGKKVLQEALVHWTGTAGEDATWEPFPKLQQQFPHLNLEDKIRLPVGGNVMTHGHKELEDGHVELEAAIESDSG